MIEKKEVILIITHDLSINQTSTFRYFSFINALKDKGHIVKGISFDFQFKPHPINSLEKLSGDFSTNSDISIIKPIKNNIIQKLLILSDKIKTPYFIKKFLLALHIIIYKSDQWLIDISNFDFCDSLKPTVIISGGAGGIIKSSYLLAKKYNAKLIIDYRDPWNLGYQLLETNSYIHFFKKKLTISSELKYLKYAEHITTVSDTLKSFFPSNFHHKITVIENGSNFEISDTDYNFDFKSFNITYTGTLYDDQLKDHSFFMAFSDFIKENLISHDVLKLQFIGSKKNVSLIEIIKKYELESYTNVTSRLNLMKLKKILQETWLFLHLKYGDRRGIITSKNADYILFNKPILLPNTDHGDIAASILKNKAGYVCNGKIDDIKEVLKTEFQKFLNGVDPRLFNQINSSMTRSEIAKKLHQII